MLLVSMVYRPDLSFVNTARAVANCIHLLSKEYVPSGRLMEHCHAAILIIPGHCFWHHLPIISN